MTEGHAGYRYDYAYGVLERVSKRDSYLGRELRFMDWVVVGSVALAREDWETAPQYWVDFHSGKIKENTDLKHGDLWNIFRINKPRLGSLQAVG